MNKVLTKAEERPEDRWMGTYQGRRFKTLNPDPADISIEDIAHAISMQCRYGGHCLRFYSVAEHSVLMFRAASSDNKKPALMHDATEGYLVDIPRMVKACLPEYYEIEEDLAKKIAKKWNIEYPWPKEVHELDARILLDERAQNMPKYIRKKDLIWDDQEKEWVARPGLCQQPAGYDWCEEEADGWPFHLEPLGIRLEFWSPEQAKEEFLRAFHSIV